MENPAVAAGFCVCGLGTYFAPIRDKLVRVQRRAKYVP
jgi:hypothetical protein